MHLPRKADATDRAQAMGGKSVEHGFRRADPVRGILLALALERRASKRDILELYLNEIYLGQAGSFSINGVGQAARAYFRKDVQNLTLPEAAAGRSSRCGTSCRTILVPCPPQGHTA